MPKFSLDQFAWSLIYPLKAPEIRMMSNAGNHPKRKVDVAQQQISLTKKPRLLVDAKHTQHIVPNVSESFSDTPSH